MDRQRQQKAELLQRTIKHIDITAHDTRALIEAYQEMSFSARELGRACDIYERMLQDQDCIDHPHGRRQHQRCRLHAGLRRHDAPQHGRHRGRDRRDHRRHGLLRGARLQALPRQPVRRRRACCASTTSTASTTPTSTRRSSSSATAAITEIADALPPRPHSSREFIREMGRWLAANPARALEAQFPRADRVRAPRADLLPGVHRQQRRLRPRRPSGRPARARTSRSTRCATSASSPSSRSRPATAAF